jgi:hypothetical protein
MRLQGAPEDVGTSTYLPLRLLPSSAMRPSMGVATRGCTIPAWRSSELREHERGKYP